MRWPRLVAAFTQSSELSVIVDAEGIDEDGAPIEGARWQGAANWQDHSAEVFTGDRTQTKVSASVYIDGDPFKSLAAIAGGTVEAFGETRRIVSGEKARNPDGSVNYTRLLLI